MKKCPYCAEQIQDEAIKCRWCGSMLVGTAEPTAGTTAAPLPPDDEALQYTHSGQRYLLGFGRDFFGVWDRQAPRSPAERFSRNDEGWRQAWARFTSLEPHHTEVGMGGRSPATGQPSGAGWVPSGGTSYGAPARKVSGAWWLLPILMGWIGGLIAWLVVKDQDPRMARAMLVTGIALSAVFFLLGIALFASGWPSSSLGP